MNLLSHRTLLNSWLQDAGVQWPSAKGTLVLNLAMREVEKHILSFEPEAFKCVYTAATTVPTTGKDNLYSYPAGTYAVHEISISSDGINYLPIPRRGLGTVRNYSQEGCSEICFVPWDSGHFMLYPSPSSAVTAGLRIIVAPTLGMTEDTDESPLPKGFETLHILEAKKLALLDVGEPTDNVQQEIDKIKNETPRFFLTNTAPMFFEPNITRY